jgi:hypothetical protein
MIIDKKIQANKLKLVLQGENDVKLLLMLINIIINK